MPLNLHPSMLVLGLSPQDLEDATPEERKANLIAMEKNVFGEVFKRDHRTGRPLEQGIGSPGRETIQHREALARGLSARS